MDGKLLPAVPLINVQEEVLQDLLYHGYKLPAVVCFAVPLNGFAVRIDAIIHG
jgi:hypothetical protein